MVQNPSNYEDLVFDRFSVNALYLFFPAVDNLSGVISDLYFAGTETTSTMLSWCIVCLVAYPDVQKKLYDSITACLGAEGTPSMGDRTQLIYVEAFYTEVLRYRLDSELI